MTIHPDERTLPADDPTGDPPRRDEAPTRPAAPAALPAGPAPFPVAAPDRASGVEAVGHPRPTLPQEDLEEVPDAISPFGPS